MKFQVLSHAGLRVESQGIELICDPWILGSSYWRSWWNYPPVAEELVDTLAPDYIYLTHIHWDHFHGPSLRRLGKHIKIIVPKGPGLRIRDDLEQMGFKNIIELGHGESLNLHSGFKITSYHFWIFLDSCLMIEADGVTLFNSNDAKIMGLPLKQLLKNHPDIDFVFRSHSSANSRLCYEVTDKPDNLADDITSYASDFADFCKAVKAKYAIPFASNQCYLHKDVFHFNEHAVTPFQVKQYFDKHNIMHPEIKIMLSGDSWDSDIGFNIQENTWFSAREMHLAQYLNEKKPVLDKFYLQEANATVDLNRMKKYFIPFMDSIPFVLRILFKNKPVVYVLDNSTVKNYFLIDIYLKQVIELPDIDDKRYPMQIIVPASVMRSCLVLKLFSHLPISKRVLFRMPLRYKKLMFLYELLFYLYEYELIPLKNLFSMRVASTLRSRWREGFLYIKLLFDFLLGKQFEYKRHLPGVSQNKSTILEEKDSINLHA